MTFAGPGLFDLQVNGFAGVDFNDPATTPEMVQRALEAMRRHGVTRCLPTLITSPFEEFARCARNVLAAAHPSVVGLHMEGPYIHPADGPRGAHRREAVRPPDLDDFLRRQEAAQGRIRLVTLAPEMPGAPALIERLVETGVRVAIGHSDATPAQIAAAVRAGATISTHLGNGCAGMLPRHPNLLWAQMAADELTACLIVDGHHLPAETVKVMIRAKTPARVALVTDATAAADAPPGRYTVGGQTIERDEAGRVTLPGGATLAGSALTLDRAVELTVRFAGVTLAEAWGMASHRPAALLGLEPAGRVTAEWNEQRLRFESLQVAEADG